MQHSDKVTASSENKSTLLDELNILEKKAVDRRNFILPEDVRIKITALKVKLRDTNIELADAKEIYAALADSLKDLSKKSTLFKAIDDYLKAPDLMSFKKKLADTAESGKAFVAKQESYAKVTVDNFTKTLNTKISADRKNKNGWVAELDNFLSKSNYKPALESYQIKLITYLKAQGENIANEAKTEAADKSALDAKLKKLTTDLDGLYKLIKDVFSIKREFVNQETNLTREIKESTAQKDKLDHEIKSERQQIASNNELLTMPAMSTLKAELQIKIQASGALIIKKAAQRAALHEKIATLEDKLERNKTGLEIFQKSVPEERKIIAYLADILETHIKMYPKESVAEVFQKMSDQFNTFSNLEELTFIKDQLLKLSATYQKLGAQKTIAEKPKLESKATVEQSKSKVDSTKAASTLDQAGLGEERKVHRRT